MHMHVSVCLDACAYVFTRYGNTLCKDYHPVRSNIPEGGVAESTIQGIVYTISPARRKEPLFILIFSFFFFLLVPPPATSNKGLGSLTPGSGCVLSPSASTQSHAIVPNPSGREGVHRENRQRRSAVPLQTQTRGRLHRRFFTPPVYADCRQAV